MDRTKRVSPAYLTARIKMDRMLAEGMNWFLAAGIAATERWLAPDEVERLTGGTRTLTDSGRPVLTPHGMNVASVLAGTAVHGPVAAIVVPPQPCDRCADAIDQPYVAVTRMREACAAGDCQHGMVTLPRRAGSALGWGE